MAPKLSIIVPIYNSEKSLYSCIDSIREQAFQNWELILIDDGSTDNSGKICHAYAAKDNRIHVFSKENGGASSARNVGVGNARGEWITFIDSDDTIEQDYLKILEYTKPDLLIQRWRFADETETREPLIDGIYDEQSFNNFMEENVHKDIMRMVASKFLKREVIEKHSIRFNNEIKLGEDTLFMLEYYSHINSLAVSNSSYYIYYRTYNWSSAKYKLDYNEFRLFFQEFYKVYTSLPFKSYKLYQFLLRFFRGKLKNKDSLKSILFVKSLPEFLRIEKTFNTHMNFKQLGKRYLRLILSFFNRFIK